MKYLILGLCFIAISFVIGFMNYISQGNILGIGLGDYILKTIGFAWIFTKLSENIFK